MMNDFSLWVRSTLCHYQVIKYVKAKVHACVWESCIIIQKRMRNGETRSVNFNDQTSAQELNGIDGETIEFEWNIFPGFTSIEILRQIPKDLKIRQINPEQFEGRTLFVSMFNDMDTNREWKLF